MQKLLGVDEYGDMEEPVSFDGTVRPEDCKVQFHIDTQEKAQWYARKMFLIETEIAQVRSTLGKYIEKLENNRQALQNLYGLEFREYCKMAMEEHHSKDKSVVFPHGIAKFRTVPVSVKVVDDEAAMKYGTQFVQTVAVLDKRGYNKLALEHLKSSGELLPGIEVTAAHESFQLVTSRGEE